MIDLNIKELAAVYEVVRSMSTVVKVSGSNFYCMVKRVNLDLKICVGTKVVVLVGVMA